MPHLHRFYTDVTPDGNNLIQLTGHEAHHALHVVRLKLGDTIEIFDGAGREWEGRVVKMTRHDVEVEVWECRATGRAPAGLTLFQAGLHRDKATEELIRHGSEIGITRIVFFPSHHSERQPRASDKWRRTAIEACKQCRRAWLPEFDTADSLEDALARATGTLLVATAELPSVPVAQAITSPEVSLFVGPEGDFTEQELGAFVAREAKAISLGDATYRSEVAAVLAAALVMYELGLLGPVRTRSSNWAGLSIPPSG
ncbi:MAG: 16S rRNA (uracil(1498)-N(3))-methyltransferase [Candidatus Hydrogenedentes bacterium]|nr:16S rRNA (uracil(1498)-N(3))-methyltransferase [Candidatus Hydrogenedentota bacterium]